MLTKQKTNKRFTKQGNWIIKFVCGFHPKYKYYSFEFIKGAKALNSKLIIEENKYQWDYRYTYEVYTDSDFITLKVGDYKLKLDRKTLILTPSNFPSHKAICEIYSIEEASEKQLQILKQEQEIFDKARKGIKI